MANNKLNAKIINSKVEFSKEIIKYFENLRTDKTSEWIDKYFNILSDSSNINSSKYRKHHIIPCFSFKDENHKNRKETLPLANNIEGNLIKLSISNHIKAHECLWKIFIDNHDAKIAVQQLCKLEDITYLTSEDIDEISKIEEECAKENITKEEKKEHIREYIAKWKKTENGKISLKKRSEKYEHSEHGKNKRKEYRTSEEGKASMKRRHSKYYNSEKGKITIANWKKSENGKKSLEKYNTSEKGKATNLKKVKKYQQTEKGKESKKRASIKHSNLLCYDPVKNDFCKMGALQNRKRRNKEKYKNVILKNCIIKS